ncbi:C-type lectin domain family 14 member A [Nothobranchius furzeri]|uniref:C-type lectin domain family 14 member A-like n=2 Tax=Nothobranchius TaxID=28779 RepID=A0A1A8UQJ8_NOTFU|nr:C-type lectin domain family 14 member A-like [Nothobranchius furzeri]
MKGSYSLWAVVFLLKAVSASQTYYTLSHLEASFDQAMASCFPGVLTTTSSKEEVQKLHELLNNSVTYQEDVTVWIGLKKTNDGCINPSLPLKGFEWVENITQESEIHTWVEEPKLTCTETLCAALKWKGVRSGVELGLLPVSCKTRYRYVCKVKGEPPGREPATTKSVALEPELRPETAATFKPELTTAEPGPASPKPNTDASPGSRTKLDSCQSLDGIETNRFKIRSLFLDPDNQTWVHVHCWLDFKLHLFCTGRPVVWRQVDGSQADFSSICHCEEGFQRNASGHCIDIDECVSRKPCRRTCLNTKGSFRCVCEEDSDEDPSCKNTASTEEKSSMILLLVLFLLLQTCWCQL